MYICYLYVCVYVLCMYVHTYVCMYVLLQKGITKDTKLNKLWK